MKQKNKLDILSYIASDLNLIHSNNITHGDLHSGNILQNDLYNAYIGDLGFAASINKTLNIELEGIYGALPIPFQLHSIVTAISNSVYFIGIIHIC